MSDFLAAALQLTSTSEPEVNFSAAEEQIEIAVRRGAELVGLPENFAFMGDEALRIQLSSDLAQQCSRFLVTMARRYQVVLLGGGFPVPVGDGQHTLNRAELVGRDGQILAPPQFSAGLFRRAVDGGIEHAEILWGHRSRGYLGLQKA